MSSYQYWKSYCGDKPVIRSSYLHNGISYTDKMTSLYWIKALTQLLITLLCQGQNINSNCVNSLRPNEAYMLLFSAKPLSELMLPYCQVDAIDGTYFSEILFKIQNFFQGNPLENAISMAAILSLPQSVNQDITNIPSSVSQGLFYGFSARLQYLQCVSKGDTAVMHKGQ